MVDYKEIIIDVRKIVRSINLESKRIQKDFGVSIPQLLCLTFLSKKNAYQATQRELTEYLNLNSSTVTGIINRLEKKGLIARMPKQGDKRVNYIALTSDGYKILDGAPKLLHDRLSISLQKLSTQKIDQIKSSLDLLIEVLDISDVDASPLFMAEEPNSSGE